MTIDLSEPRTQREHMDNCASLCTNFNGTDNTGPCDYENNEGHGCWCDDGDLSYDEYQARHHGSGAHLVPTREDDEEISWDRPKKPPMTDAQAERMGRL